MPPKRIIESSKENKTEKSKKNSSVSSLNVEKSAFQMGEESMFLYLKRIFMQESSLSSEEYNFSVFRNRDTYKFYFELITHQDFLKMYYIAIREENDDMKQKIFNYILEILNIYSKGIKILFYPPDELEVNFESFRSSFKYSLEKFIDAIEYQEIKNLYTDLLTTFEFEKKSKVVNNFSSSKKISEKINNLDNSIKFPNTQNYMMGISPTDPRAIPMFLDYCKIIGKKLDTGSLLLTPDKMIEIYKKGLKYLQSGLSSKTLSFEDLFVIDYKNIVDSILLEEMTPLKKCIKILNEFEKSLKLKFDCFKFIIYFLVNVNQNKNYEFDDKSGSKSLTHSFSKFKKFFFPEEISLERILKDEIRDGVRDLILYNLNECSDVFYGRKQIEEVNFSSKQIEIMQSLLTRKEELLQLNSKCLENKKLLDLVILNVDIEDIFDFKRTDEFETILRTPELLLELLKFDFPIKQENGTYISERTNLVYESNFEALINKIKKLSYFCGETFKSSDDRIFLSKEISLFNNSQEFKNLLVLEDRVGIFNENIFRASEERIFNPEFESLTREYLQLNDEYKEKVQEFLQRYNGEPFEGVKFLLEKELPKNFAKIVKDMFKNQETYGLTPDSEECYKKIIVGDDSNFKLYFWQQEALDLASNGKSFFIWGDTSGGKTHVMMLIIISMIAKNRDSSFVYCSPTDQLAIQTFANVLCTVGCENVSLVTECVTYTSQTSSIIIGTPKELNDFLAQYNINNSSEKSDEKLEKTIQTRKTRRLVRLAIDECHIMDETYNPTIEGKKSAKSIYNIIKGLSSGESQVQIMALSASLNSRSFENCRNKVIEASSITNIELVKYTKATSKLYIKPIVEPHSINIQSIFNVCTDSGKIIENRRQMRNDVLINPPFMLSLFHKAIKDGRDPLACFFKNEFYAISMFSGLIDFLERINENSEWFQTKRECMSNSGHISSEMVLEIIQSKIISSKNNPNPKCLEVVLDREYFQPLIDFYNRKTGDINKKIREDDILTMELYGFLYEFKNLEEKNPCFKSIVHPYLNFGGILSLGDSLSVENNGKLTTFGEMLSYQYINVKNNKLVSLMLKGLKYGIGLVTSSIPLAFQLQISGLLMRLKNKSLESNKPAGIKFVINDDSLSMGVDFPLSGVALINMNSENITISQFKQKAGRAGRSDREGNYMPSTVYCVNVLNFNELTTTDDILSFNFDENSMYYYRPDQVYHCLENIINAIDDFTRFSQDVKNWYDGSLNAFRNDSMFPEIESFRDQFEKDKYMKMCLMELFYITRILAPEVSNRYIRYLFLAVQKNIFDTITNSI